MSSVKTRSKSVANRLALIKGNWPVSQEVKESMNEMKSALGDAADKVVTIIEGVEYDELKLNTFLDKMQEAKDAACAAIILPTNPN